MTAVALHKEYPLLWEIAQQFDFAERLGGCSEPLWAEVDAALRELWMARNELQAVTQDDEDAQANPEKVA